MNKSKKKEIEIVKSKFYKLDPSKPVVAEGQKGCFSVCVINFRNSANAL